MPSPTVTQTLIAAGQTSLRANSGKVFYVGNRDTTVAADTQANGKSALAPFLTLNYAITQCTASRGDLIYVMEGHAENITAAASIACSKIGVTIVGLGTGRSRPVFTWTTATTATITITAANVTFKNCVFDGTGFDAVVTMFAGTANDTWFDNCEFEIANGTNQVALGITITGVNRFRFTNNFVHGTADAGCANFIQCVGSATNQKDFYIAGNTVLGAFTTSLGFFNNITTAMVNAVFRDNHIVNLTASATKCIVCLTGSTGLAMNNGFGIGSGAAPITMDAGWWARNWSAAAVATNGTLV